MAHKQLVIAMFDAEAAELTEDEKAALWLMAFSMRDRREQRQSAAAHLSAVR